MKTKRTKKNEPATNLPDLMARLEEAVGVANLAAVIVQANLDALGAGLTGFLFGPPAKQKRGRKKARRSARKAGRKPGRRTRRPVAPKPPRSPRKVKPVLPLKKAEAPK